MASRPRIDAFTGRVDAADAVLMKDISRRSFITTSSGLLVGLSALACGSSEPTSNGPVGTIRVTVNGLTGAAAGGSVSARKTSNTGDTFSAVLTIVTAGGTSTVDITNVPEGEYNVTWTAPTDFRLVPGTPNPQVVTVTPNGNAPATFAAQPTPVAQGVVFHSDWNTGTGTTEAVKRDTGSATPWSGVRGNSSVVETRVSAGIDAAWPTANAFVIRVPAGQNSLGFAWSQPYISLGAPASGDDRFFRLYTAMLWADSHGHGNTAFGSTVPGSGNVEHGVESADVGGSGGGDGFNPMWLCNGNGVWMMAWRDINTGQRFVCDTVLLNKFATYRVEWHCAYGAATYSVQLRVYNGAGTLMLDESDMVGNGTTMANSTFAYVPSEHQEFRIGCNGPTSNYPDTGTQPGDAFRAHGAVAISYSDWCGPYANGI
ncbi:MAG TPA: hypothetical protein VEB19_15315 [Gemmatimonadaceae bacterium]|nr:hypothetical protein [Gemmatimonadaceae bacterium]